LEDLVEVVESYVLIMEVLDVGDGEFVGRCVCGYIEGFGCWFVE